MRKVLVNMPIATLTAMLATGVFAAGCVKNTTVDGMTGDVNTGTVAQPTAQATQGTKVKAPTQEYEAPSKDMESITVELTLDGDKIIDYNIDYFAHHPKSKAMQAAFKAQIGDKIVGKSVKGLDVGIVNGASLTSAAFQKSLENIQEQL